mmetsp:Transcript_68937/g.120694  ORF Transcript_68937/g.120694 Transcript_68937/m.120694 type:complete len:123 (-) Transcript_68937:451-819(-)
MSLAMIQILACTELIEASSARVLKLTVVKNCQKLLNSYLLEVRTTYNLWNRASENSGLSESCATDCHLPTGIERHPHWAKNLEGELYCEICCAMLSLMTLPVVSSMTQMTPPCDPWLFLCLD